MDQISQEHRLISISSPLKKDELLLTSFQGGDYISRLFEFQIEVLSANVDIDPEELVGKQVTVTLQEDTERYFTGYVSHFIFEPSRFFVFRTMSCMYIIITKIWRCYYLFHFTTTFKTHMFCLRNLLCTW